MITIQDCIGLSSLSEAEVDAIAEHEHLPEIVAAELGYCLTGTLQGQHRILWMIEDDIGMARRHGQLVHVRELETVRASYLETHPTIH